MAIARGKSGSIFGKYPMESKVKENVFLRRQELEIPVVDPAISLDYSVYDELASTLFVAGHASIAVGEKLDVGLAELRIIVRKGYCFMAIFTLQ